MRSFTLVGRAAPVTGTVIDRGARGFSVRAFLFLRFFAGFFFDVSAAGFFGIDVSS